MAGALWLFSRCLFPLLSARGWGSSQHPSRSTLFSSTLLPAPLRCSSRGRCLCFAEVSPAPQPPQILQQLGTRGRRGGRARRPPRETRLSIPLAVWREGGTAQTPQPIAGHFLEQPSLWRSWAGPTSGGARGGGPSVLPPPGGNPKAPQSMLEGPNSCLCRDSLNSNLVELAAACGREPGRGAWHAQPFFLLIFFFSFSSRFTACLFALLHGGDAVHPQSQTEATGHLPLTSDPGPLPSMQDAASQLHRPHEMGIHSLLAMG